MPSNFTPHIPVKVAQNTPRGLDYFLYGPKLKAQVRQAGMQVAGKMEHDTLGVHQADMPHVNALVQRTRTKRDEHINMLLEGKTPTNQDVKSLAKSFYEARDTTKFIAEAKSNAAKIEKMKGAMFQAGLETGDMAYYDKWLGKSIKDWGGTFKGNTINPFKMAEVPDYMDIRANFRKDLSVAMRDFTPEQKTLVSGGIKVIPQQTPMGVQLVIKQNIPGIKSDNFEAVREVLSSYQARFKDRNSRESQFLRFRTQGDDAYLPALISDMQDITKFHEETREVPGQVKQSAGRFLEGTAQPSTQFTPSYKSSTVRQDTKNVGPTYNKFDFEKFPASPAYVGAEDKVTYKPFAGDEGKASGTLYGHQKSVKTFLNKMMDGEPDIANLEEQLHTGNTDKDNFFTWLDLGTKGSTVKFKKDIYDKLQELKSKGASELNFTEDEYANKFLNKSSGLIKSSRYKKNRKNIKHLSDRYETKDELLGLISKAYGEYVKDNVKDVDRRVDIIVNKPAEKNQLYSTIAANVASNTVTLMDYDKDKDNLFAQMDNLTDKKNTINGVDISGRELNNKIAASLRSLAAGKSGEVGGVKVLPGVSTSVESNPTKWLTEESYNEDMPRDVKAQRRDEMANAFIVKVEIGTKNNKSTHEVLIGNTSEQYRQPENRRTNSMIVERMDENSQMQSYNSTVNGAFKDMTNGETIILRPGIKGVISHMGEITVTKHSPTKYTVTDMFSEDPKGSVTIEGYENINAEIKRIATSNIGYLQQMIGEYNATAK